MGTDIHLAAEVYRDGQWHLASVDLPDGRNYRAFAILADVRNGYGFAGFDTGDPVVPIAYPRGFPEDLSKELSKLLYIEDEEEEWLDDAQRDPPSVDEDEMEEIDHVWLGNESFSWVTLKELLDYDLDAPVTLRGKVPPDAAQRWKENREPPNNVAAYTSNPDWVTLEWQRPLQDSAPLITELINALKPLGEPSKVRIVFGFDS